MLAEGGGVGGWGILLIEVTEVKNEWSYTSYSLMRLHAVHNNFTFLTLLQMLRNKVIEQ
jgi:hypothetical protein